MARIVAHAWLWVGLLGAGACTSSNHDALVLRPEPNDAAVTSKDSSDGPMSTDTGTEPADGSLQEAGDGAPDDALEEGRDAPGDSGVPQDGPSVLTIVNGLADWGAIRVCFEVGGNGSFAPLPVAPSPQDATGLVFARSMVLTELPGGVDLATQDIRPVLYAGDMAALGSKACNELSTLPAGVITSKLLVIPAGSLTAGRSVLGVVAGCAGGPGHEGAGADQACGKTFTATTPNATLLMATVARAPVVDRLGLQAFAGSLGSAALSLRYLTSDQFTTDLVLNLNAGVVGPKAPFTNLSVQLLGTKPEDGKLNLSESSQTATVGSSGLGEALSRGGLGMSDFINGRNYTVVWVGAQPGLASGGWWMPFTVLVVRSDP